MVSVGTFVTPQMKLFNLKEVIKGSS